MANVPGDLRYTKSHEWVRVEDGVATIGITDHAQSELGDIVFVEVPKAGQVLKTEESFGTVESVKTVSELYAPVAGEVADINPLLASQSELLNSDPYGDGWIVKIKMADAGEADGLLDAGAYSGLI